MVGSIALAAGTLGVGSVATAALLSTIGTVAGATGAVAGVASALTAKRPSNERQGQQLQFKIDPGGPVPYVMGRTSVGGTVVYLDTYGKDSSYKTYFTVLSGGGPVDGIEAFTADRAVVGFAGGNATGYYNKWMWQDQQTGLTPEPDALTNGIAVAPYGYAGTPPGWGSQSKLSGYAAASLSMLFDTKARRYANGEPKPAWILRGVRVYDPRLDSTYPGGSGACRWADPSDTAAHAAARATWVYSESPALHGLMWRLGIWQRDENNPNARYQKIMGIGAPVDMIDLPAIATAASVQAANGWRVGGQVDSQMDKWEVLKLIDQAGGAEPIAVGAMMSTLVKAPRVPLATITAADLADGKLFTPGMRPKSNRINGFRARFRSEAHGWEMTSIDIVQVPDYVAEDNRAKTGSGDFALCQDPDQCAELAAYEVFDSRELDPIVLPLKPFAMGYKLGDCLTIDLPELGLVVRDAVVRGAARDPATGICTLTLRSETAGKHPAALGLTGETPPTPTLTSAPDVIAAPAAGIWALYATLAVSGGLQVPALAIIGAADNAGADAIIFEYRVAGTSDWIDTAVSSPDTTRRVFAPIEANTDYEARVRYRARGILSDAILLGPVNSSSASADWATGVVGPDKPADNATNSADPASPFGADGTVGDAIGGISQAKQIADAQKARVDTLENETIPAIDFAVSDASDRIATTRAAVDGRIDATNQRIDNLAAANDNGSGVDNYARSELTRIDRAYVSNDDALGTRIDSVTTEFRGKDTATNTRVDNVITAYNDADTAFAERADLIEAKTSFDGYLNRDATFGDYTATSGIPPRWRDAGHAAEGTRVTGLESLYGYRQNTLADADYGIAQAIGGAGPGTYVVTISVRKIAGDLGTSAVLVRGLDSGGSIVQESLIGLSNTADINNVTPGVGANGAVYRYNVLVKVTASTTASLDLIALSGWSALGRASVYLEWHLVGIRAASDGEIRGDKADAALNAPNTGLVARVTNTETALNDGRFATAQRASDIEVAVGQVSGRVSDVETATTDGRFVSTSRVQTLESDYYGTKATVSQQAGTITGLGQRTAAYVRLLTVAGNYRAQLTLSADANGGAGADLVGDLRVSGDVVIDGTLSAKSILASSWSREATGTWTGGISPSPGQTIRVPFNLTLPGIQPQGRFLWEFSAQVTTNANTQVLGTRNGKPLRTSYIADGGFYLRAVDNQGHAYVPKVAGSSPVIATTPFDAAFVADIAAGNTDTGYVDDGDSYYRNISATYTLSAISLSVTWIAI